MIIQMEQHFIKEKVDFRQKFVHLVSFQLVASRHPKVLDIVQSFPLLSYCIVGPMSVYIYMSNK